MDIGRLRLVHQRVVGSTLRTPREVVQWLGAVQAQEFLAAKWAIGIRSGSDDATVAAAHDEGEILRTHVLRPTWHFVLAEDLRWMLALTAPRIRAAMASYDKQLGLSPAKLAKAGAAFAKAVAGSAPLTREELGKIVRSSGSRLAHMLMHAELDAVLCSGARRGKLHTWALFDERVPKQKPRDPQDAAAELARRYFHSRGPATEADFRWWSGLRAADARAAIAAVGSEFESTTIAGKQVWSSGMRAPRRGRSASVQLLPAFDEFLVSYQHRGDVLDAIHTKTINTGWGFLSPAIVVDGQVVGVWRRTLSRSFVTVELEHFSAPSSAIQQGLEAAAARYGDFLGLPARLVH